MPPPHRFRPLLVVMLDVGVAAKMVTILVPVVVVVLECGDGGNSVGVHVGYR